MMRLLGRECRRSNQHGGEDVLYAGGFHSCFGSEIVWLAKLSICGVRLIIPCV